MDYWKNLNKLAIEICKREKLKHREINLIDIKRVIRHLCDILGENWKRNYGLTLMYTLTKAGMRSIRRKRK